MSKSVDQYPRGRLCVRAEKTTLPDWASQQTAGAKTLVENHDADRARLTRSVDQKSLQHQDLRPLGKRPQTGSVKSGFACRFRPRASPIDNPTSTAFLITMQYCRHSTFGLV